HHREQERRAERPALAIRYQRPASRHAGHHHPRLRYRGDAQGYRLDLRHPRRPRKRSAAEARARTGPRAVRKTPGVRLMLLRILHERGKLVAGGASVGGRACQERREPVHGGSAQTSLFATVLASPPPSRGSASRRWWRSCIVLRSARRIACTVPFAVTKKLG